MANLVAEALRREGFYKDGTKEDLKKDYIAEDTIEIAGKTYDLSKLAYWDAKVFADELDSKLSERNPFIHEVFAKYAVNCLDLVRMVNVNSKQGFAGAGGSGNELDALVFMARQFYDPDNSTNKRTRWVRTISTTGSKYFFEGSTSASELTTAEEEALIWLAWYNPAQVPCCDAYQVTMNTEPFNIQDLNFEQYDQEEGDVIIEFKEPWILPPEQSGKISVYYFQTGTDELQPLGLWVKMARNLRDLTAP